MSFKVRRVLLLDGIDKVCGETLTSGGIEAVTSPKLSKDELINELQKYDGVVVRSATKITAEVLEKCRHLVVVGRAGTGVDNIDVKVATEMGVLVMNTPGGNTLSAAEHTCALICSLSRSIPLACASLKSGAWDRKSLMGNELFGKTLAIIGLGRIGREVTQRMKSFGMSIIGYDPLVSPQTAESWGIQYLSLDEIWPIADYITVHTPLIPQTRNLIGTESLAACKPTVKIINVARGGIVDEKALFKALEEGKCGGAGLDVFEEEPPKDLTFLQHPKVICTPHLGANTFEAQKRVAVEIAEQMIAMSAGKPLIGVVNAPSLAKAGGDDARPWIKVAKYFGSVASQFIKAYDTGSSYSLQIKGRNLESLTSLFGPSVMSGALPSNVDANLINAEGIAKVLGIVYTQTYALAEEPELILHVVRGTDTCEVKGGVFGSAPMLYSLNQFRFESPIIMGPNMTFFLADSDAAIGDIASEIGSKQLISIVSSSSSNATLFVVKTIDPFPISTPLKKAKAVAQI